MALPFLNNKKNDAGIAGTIIKQRSPDGDEPEANESDADYSAEDCAHDLMDAIHAGDAAGVVKAIQDIASKSPSESKETKVSPHTYEAQNIAAAKD